jgi:hypothetical protein
MGKGNFDEFLEAEYELGLSVTNSGNFSLCDILILWGVLTPQVLCDVHLGLEGQNKSNHFEMYPDIHYQN